MDQKLIKLIKKHLKAPDYKITPEAKLIEDFSADSLDKMELIMAVEDTFEFMIEDDKVDSIKTIQDLIDCIKK